MAVTVLVRSISRENIRTTWYLMMLINYRKVKPQSHHVTTNGYLCVIFDIRLSWSHWVEDII